MDIILLGITIVSLAVALVMSVATWRLTRDEKKRSAARVAALSVAAGVAETVDDIPLQFVAEAKPLTKAPWSAPKVARVALDAPVAPVAPVAPDAPVLSTGFLGASDAPRDSGGRQKSLAFAAVILFAVLSGGLVWMMSGPRGTSAVAVGPNSPLELVSLSHARQNQKLAVSGLVRNPAAGAPIEHLSAVVFLFDRVGTFITSSRANVDFLKLGAGDESPFVVSLDAPSTVARYRVSFRTDEGIVPHVDRRGASPAAAEGEQPINVSAK
jgi:hypothetical protein